MQRCQTHFCYQNREKSNSNLHSSKIECTKEVRKLLDFLGSATLCQ